MFLKFSKTLGIRQTQTENLIRWASTAKPSVGGFSFYILFLMSATVYAIFNLYIEDDFNLKLVGLILSCSVGFLIGLADDAYNTVPFLKFAGQLVCSIILISTGIDINISDSFAFNALFTTLWVVGIMNSVNMLDNMDGITASVSITILLCCLGMLALQDDFYTVQTFMTIGVIGAIVGFLYYNWNPAKIYMGDTGSQFLGIFLSGMSILLLWNHREATASGFQFKQMLIPIVSFTIPLMDTATVSLHRILRGQSPFVGGRDHTTHHLAYHGLKDKEVLYVFIFASLLSNALALVLYVFFDIINSIGTFSILMYVIILFLVIQYFYLSAKNKNEKNLQKSNY